MTRIAATWAFWELVAAAAGEREVVARTAARSTLLTRAGGQDDSSYTNSLKLSLNVHRERPDPKELEMAALSPVRS